MKIKYLLKIVFLNIKNRRPESFFALLGIVFGIVILIFMTAISYGLDNIVTKEMVKNGSDKTVIVEQNANSLLKLDQNAVNQIAAINGVEKVERIAETAGKFSYLGSTTDVIALLVTDGYFDIAGIKLPDDVKLTKTASSEPQPVIVNSKLAKAFGFTNPKDMLGEEVFIDILLTKQNAKQLVEENKDNQRVGLGSFRVVAVLNRGGNSQIYLSHDLAVEKGLTYDSNIWAITADKNQMPTSRMKIEKLGFATSNYTDSLSQSERFFSYLQFLLFVLGLAMLIVAGISMINTVRADLLEKKREIAYLKAIGIDTKTVAAISIVENILLVLGSALIGFLIACLSGWGINILFRHFTEVNSYQYYPIFVLPIHFILLEIAVILLFIFALSVYLLKQIKQVPAKMGFTSG